MYEGEYKEGMRWSGMHHYFVDVSGQRGLELFEDLYMATEGHDSYIGGFTYVDGIRNGASPGAAAPGV